MKEGTAIEVIRHKMIELGINNNYTLRYRHLVLKKSQILQMNVSNEIWVLIEPSEMVRVSSSMGVFEATATNLTEQQYMHTSAIKITNLHASDLTHIRFIQAIPRTI